VLRAFVLAALRKKGITMSIKREVMDLAQNDPKMCHCRVWCRETGIAGGQGGYEKGCPQLNIKYRPSKSFNEEEKLKWANEDDRPQLCLFHARKNEEWGGLPFGLITHERPKTFGSCGTPHGFKNKIGKDIKWKCDPPDYTKTHAEHPYRLRDDTSSKELLKNKYEKQLKKTEASEKYQRQRRRLAEVREAEAMRKLVEFVGLVYDMPKFMEKQFVGRPQLWIPMNPEDPRVQEYFGEWRETLTKFRNAKRSQQRRWGKKQPEFANQRINDIAYETFKTPEDMVWENPDELNDRLRKELKNYDETVVAYCDCRDILFDIVNDVVSLR